MHFINTNNVEKARKEISKIIDDHKKGHAPDGKNPLIIVQAQDDNFNRKLLEYGKFQIFLSPESGSRKTKLKQADSGLNHVTAKIVSKNNIAIGIDLHEIKKLNKKEKAERLSKIIQNIQICRKAKTKIAVNSNKREAINFLLSLGASTQQASQALLIEK